MTFTAERERWLKERGYWLNGDGDYELRMIIPFKDKLGHSKELGFRSVIDFEKLYNMVESDFEDYDREVWENARKEIHAILREGTT